MLGKTQGSPLARGAQDRSRRRRREPPAAVRRPAASPRSRPCERWRDEPRFSAPPAPRETGTARRHAGPTRGFRRASPSTEMDSCRVTRSISALSASARPEVFQHRRMQPVGQGVDVLAQPHQAFPYLAHGLASPSGAGIQPLDSSGVDRQASEALRHVVVELAREPRPLFLVGVDQPPAQLAGGLLRCLRSVMSRVTPIRRSGSPDARGLARPREEIQRTLPSGRTMR